MSSQGFENSKTRFLDRGRITHRCDIWWLFSCLSFGFFNLVDDLLDDLGVTCLLMLLLLLSILRCTPFLYWTPGCQGVYELASFPIGAEVGRVELFAKTSLVLRGKMPLFLKLFWAVSEGALGGEGTGALFPVAAHLGLVLYLKGYGGQVESFRFGRDNIRMILERLPELVVTYRHGITLMRWDEGRGIKGEVINPLALASEGVISVLGLIVVDLVKAAVWHESGAYLLHQIMRLKDRFLGTSGSWE